MNQKRYAPFKYSWGDWFAQSQFSLEQGTDYDCLTSSMGMMIRQRARKYGVVVHVTLGERRVDVQVEKRGSARA